MGHSLRPGDDQEFEARMLTELSGATRVVFVGDEVNFEGPFGSLALYLGNIDKVTRDIAGTITLEGTGAKILIAPGQTTDRAQLFAVFEEKIRRLAGSV